MIFGGETRRLLLRPLELADAAQLQATFPRWGIVRFLQNVVPWPYPPDGALVYVREMALPGMERGEDWHWPLRMEAEPERMIGMISLRREGEANRGFWLVPS